MLLGTCPFTESYKKKRRHKGATVLLSSAEIKMSKVAGWREASSPTVHSSQSERSVFFSCLLDMLTGQSDAVGHKPISLNAA